MILSMAKRCSDSKRDQFFFTILKNPIVTNKSTFFDHHRDITFTDILNTHLEQFQAIEGVIGILLWYFFQGSENPSIRLSPVLSIKVPLFQLEQ